MIWILDVCAVWSALFLYCGHEEIADAGRLLHRQVRRAWRSCSGHRPHGRGEL